MNKRLLPVLLLLVFLLPVCHGEATKPSSCEVTTIPMPTMHRVQIDGHKVSVSEAGDPHGFPILYAHGNPGSNLEVALFDAEAKSFGFRLIGIDRPGFGNSDFVKTSLASIGADMIKVADQLGILQFGLIGWSSGGPPAIAAAAAAAPDRISFLVVMGSYTDFNALRGADDMIKGKIMSWRPFAEKAPWLFDIFMWGLRAGALYLPDLYLSSVKAELPETDRMQLEAVPAACLFMQTQQAGLQQSPAGSIQDMRQQWAEWELDLARIQTKVTIVIGDEDKFIPIEFADDLAHRIPNATLRVFHEQGHLLPFDSKFKRWLFAVAAAKA